MAETAEVNIVGLILEVDGKEARVGPEQCESIYRALDRMFKESPTPDMLAKQQLDEEAINERIRQAVHEKEMEVLRMQEEMRRNAARAAAQAVPPSQYNPMLYGNPVITGDDSTKLVIRDDSNTIGSITADQMTSNSSGRSIKMDDLMDAMSYVKESLMPKKK